MYPYPSQEEETLKHWQATALFQKTLDPGRPRFSFFDGPPFANGMPHYGHLLTGYVKDAVPRYKTMKGYHVPRRFGWDTHGLPAELEAMRELGLQTTEELEATGLEVFNDACRESVLKYSEEWKATVDRQGRWVSWDDTYKTMDPDFMESTLWAFKELYKKDLVYQAFRVMPYCWHDQTPLSNHELSMDGDSYQDVTDVSATVKARLVEPLRGHTQVNLLLWTTTPWTLPANLMVAVHPQATYVLVEQDQELYLLASEALDRYPALAEGSVLQRFQGSELEGLAYEPFDPAYEGLHPRVHTVATASWVEADGAGTGLVHLAPGFGEVDKATCDELGVPTVVPMDDSGCFTSEVSAYAGLFYQEVNDLVLADLGSRLYQATPHTHSYPHCWRCGNPLVYKGVDSWFVAVTSLKERLLEKAKDVTWVNPAAERQFQAWLENVRDWGVSRNRYWGTPVPVWMSDDPTYPRTDVYGSHEELERDFGALPRNGRGEVDLHRPYVDSLTRPNPDDPSGQATMRRVPEVLDVWFDSGAMPFASLHYPFEREAEFEEVFPADFVVEYVAQTRGWFYTMHVLSVALFDRAAFKTCLAHGVVLGDDGTKMSKSKRNYPPVDLAFNKYGADALRWLLLGSPVLRGGNLVVSEEQLAQTTNRVLNPLANLTQWYLTQKKLLGEVQATDGNLMDRYLMSQLQTYLRELTVAMDAYSFHKACELSEDFLGLLSNWYVRYSRKRVLGLEGAQVVGTLTTLFQVLARALAPLLPYASERLWAQAGGEGSVHEQAYPEPHEAWEDPEADQQMGWLQDLTSASSRARKGQGVKQRQPLRAVTLYGQEARQLAGLEAWVKLLLNVKEVRWAEQEARQKLTLHPRALGPRLGSAMQATVAAAKAGSWSQDDGHVTVNGLLLEPGEYSLVDEFTSGLEAWVLGGLALDFHLDESLRVEGEAVELLRDAQQARRDAGKEPGQWATCTVQAPMTVLQFLRDSELLETANLQVTVWREGEVQVKLA